MGKRIGSTLALVVLLASLLSACGSSATHDPAVNQAKTQAAAVVHTQANTAAVNDAKALVQPCIAPYENQPIKLLSHSARKALLGCIKALVPANKRTQLENCGLKAAAHDKIWRKSGLKLFEDSGAAACVAQATKKS